jgi:transcriptional regulator with XRE-family HTH domain
MPKKNPIDPSLGVPTAEEWGRRFRRAREAKGLSQGDAAARMGVARPTYGRYEQDRAPTLDKAYEMIYRLGLDPAIVFPEFVRK